jgi:dihydroorotate dehydrogenase
MALYRRAAWPLLARMDPEDAHALSLRLLGMAQRIPGALRLLEALLAVRDPRLAVEVFGLRFPNPVGLAAGMDKDARAVAAFAALGFGAVEIGTVTPVGQPGNPRPRIFRLPEYGALINRMGFPNQGAARTRARLLGTLRPLPGGAVLGINLGKGVRTPLEEAARDYVAVLDALHDFAGYAVVNVSSPNTAGLRRLQERQALQTVLGAVTRRRDGIARGVHRGPVQEAGRGERDLAGQNGGLRLEGRRVPVLVKVAPDLTWAQLDAVVEAVVASRCDGIVATNTTLSREGVAGPRTAESGGLSGEPLRQRALEVVRYLARPGGAGLPIVGAGGISRPEHAAAMLDAGASLVQVYTGYIYAGPTLPAQLCRGLLALRRT